jgi:hypothetical protein
MNAFQWIFVPVSIFMAWRVFTAGRKQKHQVFWRCAWTVIWLVTALLICVPDIAVALAKVFGIGRGSDLVFYIAILFGMGAVLYLYDRSRRLEVILTELARRMALQSATHGEERELLPAGAPQESTGG